MTEAIVVRRATLADSDLIGRTLADAFVDDPVLRWLIPAGTSRRAERLRIYFTMRARSYLRQDKDVYVVDDGRAAALWWLGHTAWQAPPAELAREARDAIRAFRGRTVRAQRVQNHMMSLHPDEANHWYLEALGTRGADQGNGLGAALLRTVLDRADTEAVATYLESSCERNLSLYRRHGFEVIEEVSLLGNGPSIWRMWREPQT
jgi:ribosomal protein S18 acetylase RimI-like enzyme